MSAPIRLGTRASLLATDPVPLGGRPPVRSPRPRGRAGRGDHRPATAATPRWPSSAAPASSSAPCARRCSTGASTSPSTRSRTCRPRPADGIALAAVPLREDPRDVVVARDGLTLGELPVGSRVGTGSPRRAAQLHALGLGLEIVDIRGNVDTRIRKVREGDVRRRRARPRRTGPDRPARRGHRGARPAADAARPRAGCARGRDAAPTTTSPPRWPSSTTRTPARRSRPSARCSPPSRAAAPRRSGRWPRWSRESTDEELWVRAVALSPDGTLAVRMSATGDPADAAGVGSRLASDMLAEGAAQLTDTPHEQPVTDCERQEA